MDRAVTLLDGTKVPTIGQGTWFLGERRNRWEQERGTLFTDIEHGMTLIDTAEMYGDGKAEELVDAVIRGLDRSSLSLVSEAYPHNVGRKNIFRSCTDNLKRMRTDYLDMYLLHWRGGIPLEETVECMEQLKKEGKIRHWEVSNFDTGDMEELSLVVGGESRAVNQVLYHAASRGIEYDPLPWMNMHGAPVMAYCPLAQGGDLKRGPYENRVLTSIAQSHNAIISQILLAFAIRSGQVIAIPRTATPAHAAKNSSAMDLVLTEEELAQIDREYPTPTRKVGLDII